MTHNLHNGIFNYTYSILLDGPNYELINRIISWSLLMFGSKADELGIRWWYNFTYETCNIYFMSEDDSVYFCLVWGF